MTNIAFYLKSAAKHQQNKEKASMACNLQVLNSKKMSDRDGESKILEAELDICQKIKMEREKTDKSTSDVEAVIKIRKSYIEAIENKDLDRLPARTYALGYVRTYARYLSMNISTTLDAFKLEWDKKYNPPSRLADRVDSNFLKKIRQKSDCGRNALPWYLLLGFFVIFIVIYAIWTFSFLKHGSQHSNTVKMQPTELSFGRRSKLPVSNVLTAFSKNNVAAIDK